METEMIVNSKWKSAGTFSCECQTRQIFKISLFLLSPPLPSPPSLSLSSWEDLRAWFGVYRLTYFSSVLCALCRESLVSAHSVNLSGHLSPVVCLSLSLRGSWLATAPLHLSLQADLWLFVSESVCTLVGAQNLLLGGTSEIQRASLPCEGAKAQKVTCLS